VTSIVKQNSPKWTSIMKRRE